MSLSVADFIIRLEAWYKRDESIAKNIKSYPELLAALKDLDAMIGMSEAKSSIVLQLKSLLVRSLENAPGMNVFEDQMLHTVITGPPGVGKTHLGKILARIWQALGILNTQKSKKKKENDEDMVIELYKYALEKSQEALVRPLRNLNSIAKDLNTLSRQRGKSQLSQYADELTQIQHETLDNIQSIVLKDDSKEDQAVNKVPFKVISRVDLVAGYVGQTAIKTEKLLKECMGGVVFIDEAYSLIHDSKDSFGMEALTTLNQFMSEHPNDIIVIFAGYKNLMDEGIFKRQPGLKSRCSWYINVAGYTGADLAKIFTYQLHEHDWKVDQSVNLSQFFTQRLKDFPDYGRNTSKFLFYCKLYHNDAEFVRISGSRKRKAVTTKTMTMETLERTFDKYRTNHVGEIKETPPPFGFYT